MPKGLRMPIGVTTRGGAVTLENTELRRQNIKLGILPASSMHPWHQELTPPEDVVFDIADEISGGIFMSRVAKFFEEQERLGLASLPKSSESLRMLPPSSETGDMTMVVNYIDLEDNAPRELRLAPVRKK